MNIIYKHKEKTLYLVFGFLTTLISLIVYYSVTNTILNPNKSIELQIANILSWVFGFLFAYYTNRKYVFNSKNEREKEFIKFLASRIFTLLLDMFIMYIFVTLLKYDNAVFKIISQVIVIVTNYILSKIIVFKSINNNIG